MPAIIGGNGDQYWVQYDKLHRDNDLPAVIHVDGSATWWINGLKIKQCDDYFVKIKRANH